MSQRVIVKGSVVSSGRFLPSVCFPVAESVVASAESVLSAVSAFSSVASVDVSVVVSAASVFAVSSPPAAGAGVDVDPPHPTIDVTVRAVARNVANTFFFIQNLLRRSLPVNPPPNSENTSLLK